MTDNSINARPPVRHTRLRPVALARHTAQPVDEFLLVPFGEIRVERPIAGGDFVFTPTHANAAVAWFEALGRKLAIDYEHQSIAPLNPRPDGLRPAAGWIGKLQIRDDGLWATEITWTERARELIATSEYRYFSPVLLWADEDCTTLAALGPVALTNDPAMHGVQPLSQASDESPVVAALRREIALRDAAAFVDRGLLAGKIVPATRDDWREEYLRDAATAESKLSRAPVILEPGRAIAVDVLGRPQSLRTSEAPPAHSNYSHAEAEPDDFAAYDRAVAAGRVK